MKGLGSVIDLYTLPVHLRKYYINYINSAEKKNQEDKIQDNKELYKKLPKINRKIPQKIK